MRLCSRCGHVTRGGRRVRPDLCGPCVLPYVTNPVKPAKPLDWWATYDADMRRLGAKRKAPTPSDAAHHQA